MDQSKVIRHVAFKEYLDHEWTDELVGCPVDDMQNTDIQVTDEQGSLCTSQITGDGDKRTAWFIVDKLKPLSERWFDITKTESAVQKKCVTAQNSGTSTILSNGIISIKIPMSQKVIYGEAVSGPINAICFGSGEWLGKSIFSIDKTVFPDTIESYEVESGNLWSIWRIDYMKDTKKCYSVQVKLFANQQFVEVVEDSFFNYPAEWNFDFLPGLNPTLGFTHAHQCNLKNPARTHEFIRKERRNLGAITLPNYGGIYVADDYLFYSLCKQGGERVSVTGINGGSWLYPADNQIEINESVDMVAYNFPCKSGHREWCLGVEMVAEKGEELWYTTLGQKVARKYDTSLHKMQKLVCEWDGSKTPRPFLLNAKKQLPDIAEKSQRIASIRSYIKSLNPQADGDFTRYHSGGWHNQPADAPNDPPSSYLAKPNREVAEKVKKMIMDGVRNRVNSFLSPAGSLEPEGCSFINLARGFRPWLHYYDIIAHEQVFTEQEERWFRAASAFLASKIADCNYFPAEALLLHSDHPKSAHRTHWFINRESDYNFHNIDNLPHNFHQELHTNLITFCLVFPDHPQSRKWLSFALDMFDRELTEFVFPCGAWIESATYTFWVMTALFIPTAYLLRQAGIRNYFIDERFKKIFRFLALLITPKDARHGRCDFPLLGDASFPSDYGPLFNHIATLTEKDDPQFAGEMMHAWTRFNKPVMARRCQGLNYFDLLFLNDWIKPCAPKPFQSQNLTGLGALLRRNQGKKDETMFFIKCGKIYSHFHGDEGAFLLYGKGAALMDDYGVQYFNTSGMQKHHNIIEFPQREFYNRGTISKFISAPFGDYLIAEMPIHVLYIPKGLGQWGFKGAEGPFGWWRRHVLYVKESDYFVIYDEIVSPYQTTLHFHCKADSSTIQNENVVRFKGRYGVDLSLLVMSNGPVNIEQGEFCPKERNPGQPKEEDWYKQLNLSVAGAANQHFSSVIFPHFPKTSVSLSPLTTLTASKVVSGKETNLTFLSPDIQEYHDNKIIYEGRAGVVRKVKGTTEIIQLSGTCVSSEGVTIEGDGPYKATITKTNVLVETMDPSKMVKVHSLSKRRISVRKIST